MCEIGVIDTGVLLGFVIKHDQHHKTTKEYIIDADRESLYLPPRAETEFSNAESFIRSKLIEEVRNHRNEVIREIPQQQLDNNTIQYIRDQILDEDDQGRAHAFLYRYYTNQYKQSGVLMRTNLIQDLSNMEYEIQQDQSAQYGGWQDHVDTWSQEIDPDEDLKDNLLLPQSTDLDILIEGHHIAECKSHAPTEFATANPEDFIKHHTETEPQSREDDICKQTEFCNVENLINPLNRHYPN